MDDLDVAQAVSDRYLRGEIEHICEQAKGGGVSAEECEDCGEPIPEARRKAVPGCTRCVACAAELESSQERRVFTEKWRLA